ncbi:hypothetical protein TNCT_538611 [Trichonephila clavata]|uniref:Uncharacterized protein n=1 Tax=Trichonephila clavata TaxID=2740835 RepID=A0A8X6F0P1_TRICU|nr:hypothetical protein TNCT_538611 [Trichonephila clavata]
MHDFSRASEGFSGSSDSRRAPAQFVLRQPHRLIPAGVGAPFVPLMHNFPVPRKIVSDPQTCVVLRRSSCYDNLTTGSRSFRRRTTFPVPR